MEKWPEESRVLVKVRKENEFAYCHQTGHPSQRGQRTLLFGGNAELLENEIADCLRDEKFLEKPVTEGSAVKLILKANNQEKEILCTLTGKYFEYTLPNALSSYKNGKLILSATRNGILGGQVLYGPLIKLGRH